MIIDKIILDDLTEKAKQSQRLRCNLDLRNGSYKIDTTKMKKTSFLMVLTGIVDYAYKRPKDGVLVVPIGCLRD